MTLEELRPRLHALPDRPEFVPYRTSYYERTWGFCLSQRDLDALGSGPFDVVVDSTLEPGALTYGEAFVSGESDEEILIVTHVCHPSLCDDNLSGISVATLLARDLLAGDRPRRSRAIPLCSGDDRGDRVARPQPVVTWGGSARV